MSNNSESPSDLPKISVVTPSFNQGEFIEATIDSVLAQNYPNLEYIIIDGGSTDNSVEIIKKYEKYLHYWCSEPDNGQYDAINKGFAHSTGEIMAYLNSDDMYYPWTFKTVASIFSELLEVQWTTALFVGYWDRNGYCMPFFPVTGFSKESFLEGDSHPVNAVNTHICIQQESAFWTRKLWDKIGSKIITEYTLAGDFDLWARFYLHTDLYGVNCPIAGSRSHDKQRSLNKTEYQKEAWKSLQEMQTLSNWKPNIWRKLVRSLRPYISSQLYKKLQYKVKYSSSGYNAKKIVRTNTREIDAHWQIEEYKFFV